MFFSGVCDRHRWQLGPATWASRGDTWAACVPITPLSSPLSSILLLFTWGRLKGASEPLSRLLLALANMLLLWGTDGTRLFHSPLWGTIGQDCFTVPLHSPNGRHLPAVRVCKGTVSSLWKLVEISISHVSSQSIVTEAIPTYI